MAAGNPGRGNKPWRLTEDETFSSFSTWKNIMIYNLKKEDDYKNFLSEENPPTWEILTSTNPNRGFTGDGAQAKADNLNSMLRYIASYSPSFLATDIEKNCINLEKVWKSIREYYRFERSEIQFMNLLDITREENERPQRLYQRIVSHLQDNLLTKESNMRHKGKRFDKNEDMSPTVERFAVLYWMKLIHPKIPGLVKRTFATELQRNTLKELQPRIADAIDSFLEEIRQDECHADRVKMHTRRMNLQYDEQVDDDDTDDCEDLTVAKTGINPRYRKSKQTKYHTAPKKSYKKAECIVCKMANKPFHHSSKDCEILHAIRSLKILEELGNVDLPPSQE